MNHVHTDEERIELRITGTFDLPAARALCDELIAAPRTPFVVDLALAREIHHDALAHLSAAVALLRGRVALRGLTRHQARLMRYLRGTLPPQVRRGSASDAVGVSA